MRDEERRALLRGRTFRWAAPGDTSGYQAAEVRGDRVLWFSWSHVHGEGRRELGEQGIEELRTRGPLVPVPPRVLDEILAALEAA